MSLLLASLSLLVVLLSAALGWALLRLQRRVDLLHLQIGDGATALPTPGRSRPVIEIEILNPFELAVRESPLAGPAARLAPRMIERIVYARAAAQIADQLKEQGVEAQVTTHGT